MSSPQPSLPQKLQKKNWTNQEGFLRVQQSGALRGKNFGTNQNFLTFGQWARNCLFLGEVFLKELSTPHSICPEKSFETKVFFLKKMFGIFFWFRMKKLRICGRSFHQRCQKQNLRDQRKFLVKLYLEDYTTLNLLMVFVRKICFARKLQVRQYGILRVRWNILRDKILKKQNLSNFWTPSENLSGFWQNNFGRVAKTAFQVSRATFGVNWTFFRKNAILILFPIFSEKLPYS